MPTVRLYGKGGSKELITSAQSYLTFAADGRMAAFLEVVPDQPLQGCCDLVFEPAQEALEPFGIRAPEALLSLHPCGHVWIPVQNPYMVSAWLSPSTRLGCVTVLPKIVELICLNPHERNYGITELETLGLVCAQSFSCLFTWSSLCVSCLFTWSSLCGLH